MRNKFEKFIGEFVYGWIDGIITTFAVVAWATGWNLNVNVILILGFANLIADGVSMSVWNYLSTKAEIARYTKENWYAPKDIIAPLLTATATLVSFILVGFIPLLIYVLQAAGAVELTNRSLFWGASVLTGVGFLLIGIIKSRVTETSMIKSVFETLSLWVIAAILAYYVGFFLEKIITGN